VCIVLSATASDRSDGSSQAPSRRPKGAKRGRPSEDEKKRRIDHLLEVTTRIFVEEGYEAVTTRRISEAAGISGKSIYAWFPDKLALFTEVMARLSVSTESGGAEQPAANLSLEEALYRQAKRMIENVLRPEGLAVSRFLNREGYKFPDFRAFVRNQSLSTNIAVIRNIIEEKLPQTLSDDDLQESTMMFFYLVHGEVSRSLLHDLDLPTPARVERYSRRVARIFTSGV
jgi:TetR/AcrR family transcriptional repressor of mexJK operon